MRLLILLAAALITLAYLTRKESNSNRQPKISEYLQGLAQAPVHPLSYPQGSWSSFLQHLPVENGPIIDFPGSSEVPTIFIGIYSAQSYNLELGVVTRLDKIYSKLRDMNP